MKFPPLIKLSIGGFKFLFALPAFGPSTFLVVKNNYLHNAIMKSSECSKATLGVPEAILLNNREKETNKWNTNPPPLGYEAGAVSSLFVV